MISDRPSRPLHFRCGNSGFDFDFIGRDENSCKLMYLYFINM